MRNSFLGRVQLVSRLSERGFRKRPCIICSDDLDAQNERWMAMQIRVKFYFQAPVYASLLERGLLTLVKERIGHGQNHQPKRQ